MKTVLQEIIQWTIENAFNVEAQDGTTYIVIDYEEMRTKFDEWLEKERKQIANCDKFKQHVSVSLAANEAESDNIKLLSEFREKISQQKDCPPEFIDIVNKEFWNLIYDLTNTI